MKPLTVAKLLGLIANVDNPHSQSHAKQIQAAPESTPRNKGSSAFKKAAASREDPGDEVASKFFDCRQWVPMWCKIFVAITWLKNAKAKQLAKLYSTID